MKRNTFVSIQMVVVELVAEAPAIIALVIRKRIVLKMLA